MINIFSVLSVCVIATTVLSAEPPNIVLILADDVGCDWVGCYGSPHHTPSIDRLSREGVRYETAWSASHGMLSRVTLLTGQYPFRHESTQPDNRPHSGGESLRWKRLVTFPRFLQDNGYATAIGGNWQMSRLGDQPHALQHLGFGEHCVWTGTADNQPESQERYWGGSLMTNGKRERVSYCPDSINSFLIEFAQRERSNPFLIYYPMLLAHGPHSTTPLHKGSNLKTERDRYAGNITYMDQLVGRLISAIDEAGLRENTLIIFTADNGSAVAGVLHGEPALKGKGSATDYGVHVPFIVRAPFLTHGERVSKDLVDFTDIFPTILEVANVTPPQTLQRDGRSFIPSLKGSEDPFRKRSWIFSQLDRYRMVRDWQHILDSRGNFHDLMKDPRQEKQVSSLDKIAPGRRQRLEMILNQFPKNVEGTFRPTRERP